MKGLQTLIHKYLKDHEKHKRYLAIIMCLSMIVTFAVPMSLIMPAISMTNDADSEESSNAAEPLAYNNDIGKSLGNLQNANGGVDGNKIGEDIYSPGELTLKTLLVGEGAGVAWAENCNDIDALMDAAMDEYFLGIANDFCAFIEGDFAATEADAEGRVLIGGDLTFSNAWNYQVGSGDYATMTNLEATDNYKDSITNFASVIVGGRMENINTLSTGYGKNRKGIDDWNMDDRKNADADYHSINDSKYSYTVYYKPDEGLYKRFLIGNIEDSTHIYENADAGYMASHSHDYPGNCGDGCTHIYLQSTNELAQMYQYNGIPYIVQKSFEQIRERSSLLSKKKAISASGTDGTIHLIGPGKDSKEKTVYFNVGDSWGGYTNIYFDDIPDNANIVINCGGNTVNINGDVKTYINGEDISNAGSTLTNNKKESERILYNFYDATNVTINGNFNGTILAPNADVISKEDECPGHLSGALIAKSFKGGLEFGYRPYRGSADILGSSSGYAIPVDKFSSLTDEDDNEMFLPGASFEIVENIEIDGQTKEELVYAWFSSDETKYVDIPTAVDYSGDTTYSDTANTVITKNYTLKEVSAPDGYIEAENYYTITVEENIDKDYLLPGDSGGTFPQKVDVEVTIAEWKKSDDGKTAEKVGNEQTLKFTVKDVYGNNNRQRRIYIDGAEEAFAIDFTVEGEKQNPTALKQIEFSDDKESTVTITYLPSIVTTTAAEKGNAPTTTTVGTRVATLTIEEANVNTDYLVSLPDGSVATNIAFDVEADENNISGAVVLYKSNGESDSEFKRIDIGNTNSINLKLEPNEQEKISKINITQYNANNDFILNNLAITYTMPNKFDIIPGETELTIGDTVRLDVSGAIGDITWDSNNSDYLITPKEENGAKYYELKVNKPGWLVITGTDSDNDDDNQTGKTGCCVVYVNPFAITEANVSGNTATVKANKSADWTISGDDIATISNTDGTECTVTFKENAYGNATLTAKYGDYTATAELSIPAPKTSNKKVNKVDNGAQISGVDITTSSDFTIGEDDSQKKYYYSKDSLMVMPLPENNLKFVNKPGLVLRKVDDEGKAVKDAVISITPDIGEYWKYDVATGKGMVDLDGLTLRTVYTFSETNIPDGYEKADDIYFTWDGVNQIEYWTGSATKPEDPTQIKTLSLPDEHTIEMVDQRKLGVIPSLKKVHCVDDNSNPLILPGATIELHAKDGTEICTWEDFSGNETSMKDELAKVTDSPYVENGYLKPGIYYLQETKIPTCSDGEDHKDPGLMYFTVTSDFEVVNGINNVTVPLQVDHSDANQSYVLDSNGERLDNYERVRGTIPNVISFHVEFDNVPNGFWATDFGGENQTEKVFKNTYDSPITLDNLKAYNDWTGQNTPRFTYVEIETSDGITYKYDANNPLTETTVSYKDVNNALDVTGDLLTITNKPQGDKKNITIEKKWSGDDDFQYLRSDIIYKLYQTTTDITKYSAEELEKFVDDDSSTEVTINDVSQLNTAWDIEEGNNKPSPTNPTEFKLNEDNGWKQTIYGLDTKLNGQKIYYFVLEENAPDSYTASYEFKGDFIEITNTLDTISIKAEKVWNDDKAQGVIPTSLKLTLQMQISDNEWKDIRMITLTAADTDANGDWQQEIPNLPKGKKYRLLEKNVPPGWQCEKINGENVSNVVSTDDATLTIKNKPLVSGLTIRKFWENDNENQRTSVKFKLYRTTQRPDNIMPYPVDQTPEETQQDYARLLQYSLYFYDANMCGDQVDENSAYSWRGDCHTGDAAVGGVVGGFHDAGDHVMFGLPQGYTASVLSWNLYEFPEAYNELGQTPHAKIIIDYFCDFIAQCAHYDDSGNITEILVQKGNPTKDHSYWGTPELQEERGADEIWWDRSNCADIAYEYAAALTAAYVNAKAGYLGEDAKTNSKYDNYLNTAKKFYAFAESIPDNQKQSKSKIEEGCYTSWSWEDDRDWASTWLRLATGETSYNHLRTNIENLNVSWDSVGTAAVLLNAGHINTGNSANVVDAVYSKIPNNQNYLFGGESGGWGNMRHNAAYQMTALVAAKYQNDAAKKSKMTDWAKAQMAIILGNNSESGNEVYRDSDITGFEDISKGNSKDHIRDRTCFVTNFSKDTLLHPHYRATCDPDYSQDMGGKDNSAIIDGYDLDKNFLIGGLAGGWQDEHGQTYRDERSIYKVNEVACDYNACFVGAAAGLYNAYHTGQTYMIPEAAGVKTQYLQDGTVAGDYYKIEIEPVSVQSRSGLPMLTMSMAKAIRSANPYIITNAEFGEEVNIPDDIKNKITRIEVEFDGNLGNGRIALDNTGYNYSSSPASVSVNEPFNSLCIYRDWDTGFTIKAIRLYYDAGNSFTVTPSAKTLLSGDTVTLETSGNTGTVTWASDNTAVATVDENGKVTAVGIGNAKITGTDTEENTGSCTIKVEPFKITNEEPIDLSIDESVTLYANASADWSISEEDKSKVELTPSNDGMSCVVKASSGANSTVTISASRNGSTDTATINIKPKNMWINLLQDSGIINLTGNDTETGNTYTFTGPWDNITGIEIIYEQSSNFGCSISINDESGQWYQTDGSGTTKNFNDLKETTYNNITINTIKFAFKQWGDGNKIKEIRLHYADVPTFNIATDHTELYPGDTATFTVTDAEGNSVNDINDWTISPNGGSVTNNGNGTYTYKAGGKFGKIKISCINNGTKGSIEIETKAITAMPTDITVRSGTQDERQITVSDNTEITYISSNENVATVDTSGNVSFTGVGDAVITICRKGVSTDCKVNVNVLDALAVKGAENGEIVIKPNEPLKLEVENGIGDVIWTGTVPEGVTLDGDTVTATDNCTFTITATDSRDGAQTTVTIVVKDMAEIVDITGMEPVEIDGKDYIEITANDNNWQKTIDNLPITDDHGNYYFYYIVEVDDNGNPIADDNMLHGNGAKYIPISYAGNGQNLSEDASDNIISVTNKKVADTLGELPMTGGDGTTRYYVTGIAIMSTAAAYYLIRRRRRRVAK